MFPEMTDSSMKYVSLATLTLQNAFLGLCTRYVRTRTGVDMFSAPAAVLIAEVVKFFTCLVILAVSKGSVKEAWHVVKIDILYNKLDTLKVGVPSLLYTIQNNLLYIAASNLDAATYQVTYQLKILTTAIFTVTLMRRSLRPLQWLALVVLLVGVALVQLAQADEPVAAVVSAAAALSAAAPAQSRPLGFSAALAACFLSGFAGIYFEKILKGSDVSIWSRNLQLSSMSMPLALIACLFSDSALIFDKGLLSGFDLWVWFVVVQNACGGLLVAVVVKYADNILKGFATSLAIIITCVFSIYFFDFQLTLQFTIGTLFVLMAVFMYSYDPTKASPDRGTTIPIINKGAGGGNMALKVAP